MRLAIFGATGRMGLAIARLAHAADLLSEIGDWLASYWESDTMPNVNRGGAAVTVTGSARSKSTPVNE